MLPDFSDIEKAAARLQGFAVKTPVIESPKLNQMTGGRILIKAECLQRTGSFKFRGAWNMISKLDAKKAKGGVVAYSSGNHAQGVAAAAEIKGLPALIGLALLGLGIVLTLALLPGVRAEWLARAKIIEYFEIAVNWTEGYGTWIAPWIGSGFLARVVQLALIVTLSLGVFLLTAPLAAALKLRRAGGEVMDLLPLFALGMYVILILFAPPGGNGDFSEYKHRHFVELYWLFAGFTAAWAAQALPGRMVRPLAGATAVAAVLWSGWIAGRPIDAPNVTALPWAKDYFGQPVTKGIPAVAAFILAQARPGDVLAVDAAASQARLGPMNEVMALADVQAYLARGDLKSLRSACHDGVVKERVGLLQRVDAARDADAAMDLLAKAGLRFFVALSGLPRWDPAGARAAFLTDGVAVYILHRVPGEPALQAVCP